MILEESRQGASTARFDNRYLHSRYNPEREALQFLEQWKREQDESLPGRVLVVEPGLGYLIRELHKQFDPSQLYILFLSSETRDYCLQEGLLDGSSHALVSLGMNELPGLASFLGSIDLKRFAVIEWPASLKIFASEWESAGKMIMKELRIRQGNQMTEGYFAYRWFSNALENFLRYDYGSLPGTIDSPVILCASGPSLESHLARLRELQDSCIIAALPSSLRVLSEQGIGVDILFSTDPGYWAAEHLRYLEPRTLCVSPLTARLTERARPLSGFCQGIYPESLLLKGNELPCYPEMGTVAASAIQMLIRWKGEAPLYICGLDLCLDDLRIHARPHSFDPLILSHESRMKPGQGAYFSRAFDMTDHSSGRTRFTKSMSTYQNWFSMQDFPESIYRIEPAAVPLGIRSLPSLPSPSDFRGNGRFSIEKNRNYPPLRERKERIDGLRASLKRDLKLYNNGETTDLVRGVLASFSAVPGDPLPRPLSRFLEKRSLCNE